MIEIWDAYDRNFNKIKDVKLVRGEKIPNGLYHLVCDIVVKHVDGTYLLMQRDLNKHHGGLWELTSGGSAIIGETPLQCAIRELKEETGIDASDIKEIGRDINDDRHSLYVVYLCITNCDKNSIILQKGETIDYKWVDIKTISQMKEDTFVSFRTLNILNKFNKA